SCRPIRPNSIPSSDYGCISETIASRTAFSRPLARSSPPVVTPGIGCSAKPDAFDPCVPMFLSLDRTGQQLIRSVIRQTVAAALQLIDHLIVDSDDMVTTAEQLADKNLSTTLLPLGIDTEQFRLGLHRQRKEWRERF